MSPVPIYREGENFFVPTFEVRLAEADLADDVIHDVMQVTYKDGVSDASAQQGQNNQQIDSFELTLNNWDASKQKFKYEPPSDAAYDELFAPGKELTLSMGYAGNTRLMIRGQITTIEPSFTESGPATIAVRGLNALHRFRKKQHTWAWPETKRDSDIALEIGQQRESDNRPGLGIRVVINEQARNTEPTEFVFMNNQYDIAFLLDRARRRGYVVYLDEDDDGQFLYFGPGEDVRQITYQLEWGRSLSSFRPTLTTANQVSKVTVLGWDRTARRPIRKSAEIPRDCPLNSDHLTADRALEQHEEIVSNYPVRTDREAEQLARDILCNFRRDLVRGSGVTVGLPDLRAGNRVVIANLGSRFSGNYFVTASTHTIGADGYRTTFEARREGPA